MIFMDVDTAVTVPVNVVPLVDDTDFKTRETGVAYNAGGMDLVWNFVTSAGVITQTAVTPTTSGDYDWTHVGDGIYKIEIPASGGASINNDTEGYGWFSGVATGVLPWTGPIVCFRASGINDKLCDSAYSATRGLGGTALPDAAANAAGGLPISTAGSLDLDAQIGTKINDILTDTGTTLQAELDGIQADTEDIQTRLPAALVSGRMDSTVDGTGMESGALTAIWEFAEISITGGIGARLKTGVPNAAPGGAGGVPTVDASNYIAGIQGGGGLNQLDDLNNLSAAAVLAAGDVDGFTLEETLKLCLAALAGKLSGAATTTITIRSADDSADRITATVDANGNRTAVTLNEVG
jgi:hypothetical protein